MSSQPIQVEVRKKGGCLSGCATFFGVLLLIGLAVTYWYVAVPLAVIALIVGLVYWNSQRNETYTTASTTPPPSAPDPEPGPSVLPTSTSSAESGADALEQLRKLGELRDAGVITNAEFETKKAKLLGRI